jgi:23S rRNA pseudouridine1911/1915/1917 synthase
MASLVSQFRHRKVTKEYLALVWGIPRPPNGRAETLIGRHPRDRKRMSATPISGRPAITSYETAETFQDTALLRVKIETGRTHQIRVHMTFLGHPIVGDPQYGRRGKFELPIPCPDRQMLHAARLSLLHPRTGSPMIFEAPLPTDMATLLSSLRSEV